MSGEGWKDREELGRCGIEGRNHSFGASVYWGLEAFLKRWERRWQLRTR